MMQEHLLNNNIGCIEICVQGFKIIGLALLNNNIGCIEVYMTITSKSKGYYLIITQDVLKCRE